MKLLSAVHNLALTLRFLQNREALRRPLKSGICIHRAYIDPFLTQNMPHSMSLQKPKAIKQNYINCLPSLRSQPASTDKTGAIASA